MPLIELPPSQGANKEWERIKAMELDLYLLGHATDAAMAADGGFGPQFSFIFYFFLFVIFLEAYSASLLHKLSRTYA